MQILIKLLFKENSLIVIFLILRYLILPLKTVINNIPIKGTILEVGSGHGLLSYYFAYNNKNLNVIGIDPDLKRINFAKKNFENLNNLKFQHGLFGSKFEEKNFDCIMFYGVFCLMNDKNVISLLKAAKLKLKKNSVIYISDILKNKKSLIYYFHILRENFFKIVGFTKGDIVISRSNKKWNEIFIKSGFEKIKVINAKVPFHSTIDYLLS